MGSDDQCARRTIVTTYDPVTAPLTNNNDDTKSPDELNAQESKQVGGFDSIVKVTGIGIEI